jgi:uncharacterized protein (TIGR02186 family)
VVILGVWLVGSAGAARAEDAKPLVVDLSEHLVAISTGFAGASVLLFGAVEEDGDVVVVVRGPPRSTMVWRRERLLGVFVNRAHAVIRDAPAYYRIASSRPLEGTASPAVLQQLQWGVDRLEIHVDNTDQSATDGDYRQALLRLNEKAGFYAATPGVVNFIGGRLFRTEIDFPANVPTGFYTVQVYLLRGGAVVSRQASALIISKVGVGAEVFDFAYRRAPLYGLMAIVLAMVAGWAAAIVFRRG